MFVLYLNIVVLRGSCCTVLLVINALLGRPTYVEILGLSDILTVERRPAPSREASRQKYIRRLILC